MPSPRSYRPVALGLACVLASAALAEAATSNEVAGSGKWAGDLRANAMFQGLDSPQPANCTPSQPVLDLDHKDAVRVPTETGAVIYAPNGSPDGKIPAKWGLWVQRTSQSKSPQLMEFQAIPETVTKDMAMASIVQTLKGAQAKRLAQNLEDGLAFDEMAKSQAGGMMLPAYRRRCA